MEFEWDDDKARANAIKHGIGFETAVLVFVGPHRLTFVDDRQNYGEARQVTMGAIEGRVLVVVHVERPGTVRIISARKANRREQQRYADHQAHD